MPMKYILIILTLFLFSCSSVKKQEFKAQKFYKEHKKELANLCNAEFQSETIFIQGETKIQRDTTYINVPYTIDCDSVVNANKDTNKPNLVKGNNKVPFVKETQKVTDTIQKSNSFLESKLRHDINELEARNTLLNKENESLLKQAKKDKTSIYVLVFLLGFAIVVIIRK